MSTSQTPHVLLESNLDGLELASRGKVRDVYKLDDDRLLMIATDRISAFDVVLPQGVPDKGRVLTQTSCFWFDRLSYPNHLVTADVAELPEPLQKYADQLRGRFMLVEALDMLPIECVVRGYLVGSGWKDYQNTGAVCGIDLPEGLVESARLPEPIFTPATKAVTGHDENIPFSTMVDTIGEKLAEELRAKSLDVYSSAAEYALTRGIILADTKFEWGIRPSTGELVIADEALTPDSSRYWEAAVYEEGKSQPSFDKQFVRDYLQTLSWDKTPPGPNLPDEVVQETANKYREIYERLTGRKWSECP